MSCSVKVQPATGTKTAGVWPTQRTSRIADAHQESSLCLPSAPVASTGGNLSKTQQTSSSSQQQSPPPRVPRSGCSATTTSTSASAAAAARKAEDTLKLLRYIDDNLIGRNGTFLGPFGRRKVVYCDYTATGRSLQFLEDYIIKEVLPYLGDTRASTSICSLQSSLFRHEARDIVRHAVGAGEEDAVLFTGQGSASALRTLLRHLNLRQGPTIVFTGPFEHYANLRPWRDHNVQLVRIDETREGFLDLNDLERKLVKAITEQPSARMIGYFSAASCITGVLADDVATTLLLRQHGALSIWDYTSAAPYTKMEMNANVPGVGETKVHKDAIIFAGHKFIGGAQSPGVLVAKRCLLNTNNGIATSATITSCSSNASIEESLSNLVMEDMRDSHRHLKDPELRDESGTGGVVEAIRCGLAVQLKENLTHQAIATRQDKISKQVLSHVRTIPELILLGCSSHNVKRLPTFSFMVRHPRGTFLHHNFVCAVLNDVFGVQARGGCACAGRYAHDLMGIDQALAKEYEALLFKGSGSDEASSDCNSEPLRPGFARLTLPYFMPESEVAFVLEALKMVATEGWKLLPQYVLNPDTGEWRHHTNSVFKERRWLGSIRYTDGRMSAAERRVSGPGLFPQSHADCLQTARNIFNRARKMAQRYPMQIDRSVVFDEHSEDLRWFMLPHEAQDLLLGHSQNVKHHVPFDPSTHKLGLLETATGVPCNSNNCSASNNSFSMTRRLNSEPCRMGPITPLSPASPRHRSLPALTCPPEQLRRQTAAIVNANRAAAPACCSGRRASENDDEVERQHRLASSPGNRSPATCPASPMPSVRFAVGEAVTSASMIGSTSVNKAATNCTGESTQDKISPDASSQVQARARCNSLGSSSSCRVRSGSYGGGTSSVANGNASSPVPIPLSPQTLASLGISQSNGQPRHRHCSCSSQTELNGSPLDSAGCSPGRSASSLGHASVTSPGGSCSSSFDSVMNVNRLGRSSPILSMSHSSEDDLRAYLKEVTKELATEIKSEIREVISKVDDALSETSLSSEPGLHHSRSLEKQQNHHDSFSASDIAEYLMEFSKEMASEVKSEIRCMVNSVDGLHRYSPEDKSSPSCGSPSERRRLLPTSQQSTPSSRSPRGTLIHPHHHHHQQHHQNQQQQKQQHDSKMSSECSSDETVIFVVKSPPSSTAAPPSPATTTSSVATTSKNSDDEDSEGEKSLPKIYSAINSVSSQDSGINLSFHDSDRSLDHQNQQQSELARSSSAETATSVTHGVVPGLLGRRRASALALCKQSRADEQQFSEDDESTQSTQQVEAPNGSGPWLCPPKNVWKPSVEALHEFDMLRDGDKVLVCLFKNQMTSSICLLHTMHQYRSYARSKGVDYELGVASTGSLQSELLSYLDSLGVPHHVAEEGFKQHLLSPPSPNQHTQSDKTVDTAMEALYGVAKSHGYGVLALAHNLDDLADAFLGALFNEGKLATMRAHCVVKEHALRIIRPFVYVRDKAIQHFVEAKKIPAFGQSSVATDEQLAKAQAKNEELLGLREAAYPRMYWSLRSALRPLISAQALNGDSDQQTHNKRQHIRRGRTSSFGAMPLGSNSSSSLSSAAAAANLQKQPSQTEESDECSDDEAPIL